MRFVEPKIEEQQARAILFRARERLVHQRTELVNALRAVLYEFGYCFPNGISNLKNIAEHLEDIAEHLEDDATELPSLVREECQGLLKQIKNISELIKEKTLKARKLAATAEASRRLQTIPGIGPLTTLAIEAFAPDMSSFRRGRDFAAWLGLVPRQYSSGGKTQLETRKNHFI